MLRNEHPQIIAIVLSYLDSDQAAEVLTQLPEAMRADILMRVATLDGVHPTALNELDEVLEKQFSGNAAPRPPAASAARRRRPRSSTWSAPRTRARSWRRSPRWTSR